MSIRTPPPKRTGNGHLPQLDGSGGVINANTPPTLYANNGALGRSNYDAVLNLNYSTDVVCKKLGTCHNWPDLAE